MLYTLVVTHITIIGVTVYLHRCQAHRALELHPVVSHFFRFWLWMTTGMLTGQWAAIHRKHHAKCETEEDPHSPQTRGIWKVLLEGAELYRTEAKNEETMRKFSHGTPNDWMERNVYTRYPILGVSLMMVHRRRAVRHRRADGLGRADDLDSVLGGGRGERPRALVGLSQLQLRRRQHQHLPVGHPHRR